MSRRGVKKVGTWRTLRVLIGDMGDWVIPDVINDVLLLQGRYPENFMLIYQFEVCQEGGAKKGGSRRGLLGGR